MKIKWNEEKSSYTLKGLDYDTLALIAGYVYNTRLGFDGFSAVAANLSEVLHESFGDEIFTDAGVDFTQDEDGFVTIETGVYPESDKCSDCSSCNRCGSAEEYDYE